MSRRNRNRVPKLVGTPRRIGTPVARYEPEAPPIGFRDFCVEALKTNRIPGRGRETLRVLLTAERLPGDLRGLEDVAWRFGGARAEDDVRRLWTAWRERCQVLRKAER